MDSKILGRLIKEALFKKGITQKKLGERIGKNPTMMSQYINGDVTMSFEVLLSIANALDMNVSELIGEASIKENRSIPQKHIKAEEPRPDYLSEKQAYLPMVDTKILDITIHQLKKDIEQLKMDLSSLKSKLNQYERVH